MTFGFSSREFVAILSLSILLIFLSGCSAGKKTVGAGDSWQLTWSDEFNYEGLPDTSRWSYDVGGHGWGNHELEYYAKSDTFNANVKEGILHIIARNRSDSTNPYSSARLVTRQKGDWLYGKIEVSAKLPEGRGLWPAIWMLPTSWEYGGWPASGEIDIMEHVGYMRDSVFFTVHTKAFNHTIGTQRSQGIFIKNLYSKFHVYGIEWSPEKIDFFLDEKLVFTYENSGNGFEEWPFDKKFHLIINLAVGGDWGGSRGIDPNIFPAVFLIDYVRVFQKKNQLNIPER